MHHARQRRRRRTWIVLLLLTLALLLWCRHHGPPLVLGTFNIRTFPAEETDLEAVAAALAGLDADAFTVQEIGDPKALKRVLAIAGARTGRRYEVVLSASCRGRRRDANYSRLHLGVVYDAARVELVERRDLSSGDSCPNGQPPATLALLRPHGGPPLALVSVHFQPGRGSREFAARRQQWQWLVGEIARLEAELGAPVVVAGDFNSTGYLAPASHERRFIDGLVEGGGLQLPSGALGCSMYWQPDRKRSRWVPSLLDHVLAPRGLEIARTEALGMCAALACEPQERAPAGFDSISDHCPVRFELRR